MNDFLSQIQCDELTTYEPTQADWEEYNAWLEEQEAAEPLPEHFDEYEWTEEAIEWEEGMHPDNLYDDEDFDDIGDNELYEDRYNGEPFEDTYNDYDAWEEYCDYE